MKKIISAILALVLMVNVFSVGVIAAENGSESTFCAVENYSSKAELVETIKDCPIRTGAGQDHRKVANCPEDVVLEVIGHKVNKHLNLWYKVNYRDSANNICYTGYIYSKNVRTHTCSFDSFTYDGVTYHYCDCGKITVTVKTNMEVKKADAVTIAGYATTAGITATADGPLPLGDMIAVGILVATGLAYKMDALPTVTMIEEVIQEVDFDEYVEENDACPSTSYRKVARVGGTLKYIDDDCMTAVEAYVYVRAGGDVYASNMNTAAAVGALHTGGCFSEIDGGGKDYWYHYHLGAINEYGKHIGVVGGHIFYGESAITHRVPS